MKRLTITAIGAAILLLGGTAVAQPGNMGGRMNQQGAMNVQGGMFLQRMLPMLRHLDLTDDQMEQVHEIIESAGERLEVIHNAEDGENMRDRFKDLFTSSSITAAQVADLLNERLDYMEETNSIIAEAVVDIHNILTAEQLQAISEFEPGEGDSHPGRTEEHAPMMRGGSGPGIHSMR